MAKIITPNWELDFMASLDADAVARYIDELATEARTTHPSDDMTGEVITFPVADGAAVYLVWSSRPPVLMFLPVYDRYRLPAAHERGLTFGDITAEVNYKRKIRSMFQAEDDWWDAQEVGTVLHYHNGFGEYVRCVVVDGPFEPGREGKHLQPLALVGNWGVHDLHDNAYHAGHVVNRDGGWRCSTGCVYEHPKFVGPRGETASIDPTVLPALEIQER